MWSSRARLVRTHLSDFGKLDHLPGRIPAISNLLEQLCLPLFDAFDPVHDRNVDHSVAAPDLRRNRFSDGATRGDNVVESPDARVVLSNGIRANESCALGLFKLIVRFSEPVNAIVGVARNFWKQKIGGAHV